MVIEASLDVVFLEVMVALCMLAPLEAKLSGGSSRLGGVKGLGLALSLAAARNLSVEALC